MGLGRGVWRASDVNLTRVCYSKPGYSGSALTPQIPDENQDIPEINPNQIVIFMMHMMT